MAEITTILGTDSISSSRLVINDNFNNLNDELTSVTNALDTTGSTLSLTGNISGGSLTITGKFVVGSSTITATLPTIVGNLTINGGLTHSSPSAVITATSLSGYDYTTYPLDAVGTFDPGTASNGVEITLISTAGTVTITATSIAGATSISMPQNSTLTIRWWDGAWYIVSHYGATIS